MNTLPNSSEPYDSLQPEIRDELLTVIHYILLFHTQIGISEYHILYPTLENSLMQGNGEAFTSLIQHVRTQLSVQLDSKTVESDIVKMMPSERITYLSQACSIRVGEDDIRACLFAKEDPKERQVVLGARLNPGPRDGCSVGYMWVRGLDGCASCRVQAGGRVWAGSDIHIVAEAIDIRGKCGGGRADMFVASWLRDRSDRAELRSKRIIADWEALQQSIRDKERRKNVSLSKMGVDNEGCIVVDGQRVAVGDFGRGKRERRQVCYDDTVIRDIETVEIADGDDDNNDNDESGDDYDGDAEEGEYDDADDDLDDLVDEAGSSEEDDDAWVDGDRTSRKKRKGRAGGRANDRTRSGRLKRGGDGSWARKNGPRAEGRLRVDTVDDAEEKAETTSRAVRAARRQQLKDA